MSLTKEELQKQLDVIVKREEKELVYEGCDF